MPEQEDEKLTDNPNLDPPSEVFYNSTLPPDGDPGWVGTCGKCHMCFPADMLDENAECPTCRLPEIRLESEALKYDWKNIDDEEFRVYEFPDGCKVVIDQPLKIHVSKSGGHRIFDSNGVSHYIPTGWIHLWWIAKENEANFRF